MRALRRKQRIATLTQFKRDRASYRRQIAYLLGNSMFYQQKLRSAGFGDAAAVVAAVNAYLAAPSLYRRHSESALRVGATFTWASEEKKLLDLYSRLIGPPQGR